MNDAPKKKIRLIYSITHNHIEYSAGIHELPEELADLFLAKMPHAAELPSGPEAAGITKPKLTFTENDEPAPAAPPAAKKKKE
jgi:hypothetical protein